MRLDYNTLHNMQYNIQNVIKPDLKKSFDQSKDISHSQLFNQTLNYLPTS